MIWPDDSGNKRFLCQKLEAESRTYNGVWGFLFAGALQPGVGNNKGPVTKTESQSSVWHNPSFPDQGTVKSFITCEGFPSAEHVHLSNDLGCIKNIISPGCHIL